MMVQAMWDNDSHLKQLPHLSDDALAAAARAHVETIYDFQEMDDALRGKLLHGLTKRQVADVAAVSNRYPEVEVSFAIEDEANLAAAEAVSVVVQLQRDEEAAIGPVTAPLFPKELPEGWWLVVGDTAANTLLGIKRVTVGSKSLRETLQFVAPSTPGTHKLTLYLMSDSFVGCDQEFELMLNLAAGGGEDDDGDAQPMQMGQ